MANSNMQATDAVAQDTASASGEFDALLNQAFRPKTTQAAKAVEAAVQSWRNRRWRTRSPSAMTPIKASALLLRRSTLN